MRCGQCHSYIPEGLSNPRECPACHALLQAASPKPPVPATAAPTVPATAAFATQATYPVKLVFGPTAAGSELSAGSISFGKEGLSIVSESGKRWDKIPYKEISRLRLIDWNIIMDVKGVESKLAVFPAKLPSWLFFLSPLRKKTTLAIFEKLQSLRNVP